MRNAVIGQTGKVVLSNDAINHKLAKKRTLRFQYTKMKHSWIAWICGPFHSRMYGVVGCAGKRNSAKVALERILANDYGYHGNLLLVGVDSADTVGE